jgi:hypothetical protein
VKMKLISLLMLMGAAPVMADSLIGLPTPSEVVGATISQTYCVGGNFGANNSISGACQTRISQACSGRGCNPVQTVTVYVATWDAAGNAISAVACESVRHHTPQADVVTYLNGYTSCPSIALEPPGGTVVVLDGIPFYYVSTDPVTGAELVNSNAHGYLYLP